MIDPRLQQLILIAGAINPGVTLVADLALVVWGAIQPRGISKELKKTLVWVERRSIELLKQIIKEAAKADPSQALIHELEVRLHETLDLLMDMKQERPWGGGTK